MPFLLVSWNGSDCAHLDSHTDADERKVAAFCNILSILFLYMAAYLLAACLPYFATCELRF